MNILRVSFTAAILLKKEVFTMNVLIIKINTGLTIS